MNEFTEYYERHLPHWQPPKAELFITWRLAGSLPNMVPSTFDCSNGREFVQFDRLLDRARTGPLWLKDPRLAEMVVDGIEYGQSVRRFYESLAYVVMANHVHLLIGKVVAPLATITKCLKGYTARRGNQILGRTGQTFWQNESFDHWVRDAGQLKKIVRYVEYNPVAARLVSKPEEWPWSSATRRC